MMIDTLLDACEFVLREQGEPQSSFWLASQVMEMKLWRASEADVRDALTKDIEKLGGSSRFVKLPDDEFASVVADRMRSRGKPDETTDAAHTCSMAQGNQAGYRRCP